MLKYKRNTLPPWFKAGLDFGPLLLFFGVYRAFGLLPATAALMTATFGSLLVTYGWTRKVALLPIIMAALIGVLGTLTLVTKNEIFIKMKPTVLYLLFAFALFIGQARGHPMLKYVLDSAMHLTPEGWRLLGLRWAVFFVVLAAANELVWRNFPTDTWVNFKVLGMPALTLLFTFAQIPLMKRTMIEEDTP